MKAAVSQRIPRPKLLARAVEASSDDRFRGDRRSAVRALCQSVVNSSSDPLLVMDAEGVIQYANASWSRASEEEAGWPTAAANLGGNFLDVCRGAEASVPAAGRVLRGVQSVLGGVESEFRHEYSRCEGGRRSWYTISVRRLPAAAGGAVLVWADSTKQRTAQRQVRALSRMLLSAHERERRAVARELHDDITQVLAATAIDLSLIVPRFAPGHEGARAEIAKLVERLRALSKRVQAISHRMHPHALRTLGLARALEGECKAFASRTGIGMRTRIRTDRAKVPAAVELAVFRVAQECLNNIVRHARASAVRVSLAQTPRHLRLTIRDTGVGFDLAARRAGIGLLGMRERALAVGGRVSVVSAPGRGAAVTFSVPMNGGRP